MYKSELLEEMKGRRPVLGDMGFPNNNNDFEPEYLPNLQQYGVDEIKMLIKFLELWNRWRCYLQTENALPSFM